jgi:hypothetical protein
METAQRMETAVVPPAAAVRPPSDGASTQDGRRRTSWHDRPEPAGATVHFLNPVRVAATHLSPDPGIQPGVSDPVVRGPGPVVLRWPDLPDSARAAWDAAPRPTDPAEHRPAPVREDITATGPWPRLHDDTAGDPPQAASQRSGWDERWHRRTPAATTTTAPVPTVEPGRWPELPDDTPQWRVTPRPGAARRLRRLDEEQRGLPWNA